MATKHTIISYNDMKMDRAYTILKTHASNIKLVSFTKEYNVYQTVKNIRDTAHYGMNASFFEPNTTADNTKHYFLYNIAYQDGIPLASTMKTGDAVQNQAGSSVIYWNGTSMAYASGITSGTSSTIPKTSGSWAQGGMGLYLCDSGWLTKFTGESNLPTNTGEARTGILINTSTKDVYLFITKVQSTNIGEFRHGMMSYVGISDSTTNNTTWYGLLTDGGRSSQLRGDGANVYPSYVLPPANRAVPQIIALKDIT